MSSQALQRLFLACGLVLFSFGLPTQQAQAADVTYTCSCDGQTAPCGAGAIVEHVSSQEAERTYRPAGWQCLADRFVFDAKRQYPVLYACDCQPAAPGGMCGNGATAAQSGSSFSGLAAGAALRQFAPNRTGARATGW
ncbi:MAG TPA: hypothetical protein VET25_05090, partial [Aestuariivirgaceae bacterium]|nr:hypothetical protein [Aestuariivirgaceae bacterium]